MRDILGLLKLAKSVKNTFHLLDKYENKSKNINADKKISRELKSKIDHECEKNIIKYLSKTSIPILSEESARLPFHKNKGLLWVVDPLDGTVNYVRNFSSCSISVALFRDNKPVFGVIGVFPSKKIYFGGPRIKSFVGRKRISVSKINDKKKAIICSGFLLGLSLIRKYYKIF